AGSAGASGRPGSGAPAGAAMVVTIDRPPLNALDLETIETLGKTFASLASSDPTGSVVLTGAGARAFSAGVDTKAAAAYDPPRRRALVLEITRMTAALLSLPCPIVAAANAHALPP